MDYLRRSSLFSKRESISDVSNRSTNIDELSDVPTIIITRSRIKYGKPSQAAMGMFIDYCRNTSIHGVRYFGERKRPFSEKFIWTMIFLISILVSFFTIMNIKKKWNETPVVVSFTQSAVPISTIPFPSVVVCSDIKVKRDVFNYTRALEAFKLAGSVKPENMSNIEFEYLQTNMHICDYSRIKDLKLNINDSIDILENLEEMTPELNETLPFCMYKFDVKLCLEILHKIITEEGICYQFNGLNGSDLYKYSWIHDDNEHLEIKTLEWSLEDGYDYNAGIETFPERVLDPGAKSRFAVIYMDNTENRDYFCRGRVHGLKIFLLSPDDVPQASRQYIRVPSDHEILISVKPNLLTTSEALRKYGPETRLCFFNGERNLHFFKIYTELNCNYECLINYTLTKCGCVRFSMPRTEDTRICDVKDIKCYQTAEQDFMHEKYNHDFNNYLKSGIYVKTMCNCLPACTSLTYDVEISKSPLDLKRALSELREVTKKGFIGSRMTLVFKEQQFYPKIRTELYGVAQFIANCGGILGLFLGISLLSLVEIFYFCTFRLIAHLQMRKRKIKQFMTNFNVLSSLNFIYDIAVPNNEIGRNTN